MLVEKYLALTRGRAKIVLVWAVATSTQKQNIRPKKTTDTISSKPINFERVFSRKRPDIRDPLPHTRDTQKNLIIETRN